MHLNVDKLVNPIVVFDAKNNTPKETYEGKALFYHSTQQPTKGKDENQGDDDYVGDSKLVVQNSTTSAFISSRSRMAKVLLPVR